MASTVDQVHENPAWSRAVPERSEKRWITVLIEGLGLLAAPAVLFWVLRLRSMAPVQQQDPSMHTTFFMEPLVLLNRFGSGLGVGPLQDSARVGFLVPARVTYLLFGAVPGFLALRYVLALVAIVPTYLLLRKLYGRPAGWVGVVLIMSSPVVVGTWGSDYSSSAVISYLLGGQAALALSLGGRRWDRLWLLGAAILATLSIWSNAICLLVILPTFAIYLVLRFKRDRRFLGWDLLGIAAMAVGTTGFVGILSKLLLGHWNFIQVTIQSSRALGPIARAQWHSKSWAWAPYDLYLLVLPATIVAFFIVFSRRRGMRSSVLLIGIAGTVQIMLFAYLQFFNTFWIVETPPFSSFLWAGTTLMLALLVSEIMVPWTGSADRDRETFAGAMHSAAPLVRSAKMAVPGLVVLAIPLLYEAAPQVPAMKWSPWGYVLVVIIIAAAVGWRLAGRRARIPLHGRRRSLNGRQHIFAVSFVTVIVGASLVLTANPEVAHAALPNTSAYTPYAEYSSVLGGNASPYVEEYRAVAKLPAFIGKPAYKGEQLLMWADPTDWYSLLGPIGFNGGSNFLFTGTYPTLDATDLYQINVHHPRQILLMGFNDQGFAQAVKALSSYGPSVVRRGVLGNRLYPLHVWLVELRSFAPPPAPAA